MDDDQALLHRLGGDLLGLGGLDLLHLRIVFFVGTLLHGRFPLAFQKATRTPP
jgi:hypothetical protein